MEVTCMCLLLKVVLMATELIQPNDTTISAWTVISITEFPALLLESALASSTSMINAKRLLKKMMRHPWRLSDT